MNNKILASALASSLIAGTGAAFAAGVDADAATDLARQSKCFKCHSVDKKKEGPSYHSLAEKYKGKADAEDKLIKHVTVPNKVKVDGEEQDHPMVKIKDPAAIKNLVDWILSR
ncbi:MAG: c-type cytochrome [Betaproteobacteria bacterium]|nr:c-type cytochrome [Betaproteobacteria bacterium]